jgi:DegV family protein with EDD domain
MFMSKIKITTDGTCDLSEDYLLMHSISIIPFHIKTDMGVFRDQEEITGENLFEYVESKRPYPKTMPISEEEYRIFFREHSIKNEKVLHISVSSGVSESYKNAALASTEFSNVIIIDSQHVSLGTGLLVAMAACLLKEGKDIEEIVTVLEKEKRKVSTSFIVPNLEHLQNRGRISLTKINIIGLLPIMPSFILKDGIVSVTKYFFENKDRGCKRYVEYRLKGVRNIDTTVLYIVTSGCSQRFKDLILEEVRKHQSFDEIIISEASATVACQCGKGSYGLIYKFR